MTTHFLGYPRRGSQWKFGIRNHVVVLSAMDNVNGVVNKIAAIVPGIIPLPIWYGRGQYGKDDEQTQRTIRGVISNPNVGGVVIVSLETRSANKLADFARGAGVPTAVVVVQEAGNSLAAVVQGAQAAADLRIQLSDAEHESTEAWNGFVLGVECGGSDTTSGIAANPVMGWVADQVIDGGGSVILSETSEILGAEHVLAARAVNQDVANDIIAVVAKVETEAKRRGVDIRGANPVPDNIKGGLTTIEEKSLGAIIKAGSRPVQGVLEYAYPVPGPGLWVMDTPAPAAESLTGLAAGGAHVILFSTGQGNIAGFPTVPVIKVSAHPETVKRMKPNIDFDASAIIAEDKTIEMIGQELLNHLVKIANGRLTKAEVLNEGVWAISRIEPTV